MKTAKKMISFFLVLCMLMTYIPDTMVYASEENASEENATRNSSTQNSSTQNSSTENNVSDNNASGESASERIVSEEIVSEVNVFLENTASGATFSSGSGTENDPYIIGNADDFKKLAEDVNGGTSYEGYYFKVSDDVTDPIELSSSEGFEPIGKTDYPFEGTFDGNGKTVKLNLDLSSKGEVGLFGNCGSKSVIKNVTTTGSVTGQFIVGGIVGQTVGDIINCHNQAAVTGGDAYVGGIVGHASNTYGSNYLINCSNSGAVSGKNCVGGIIGNMDTTYVINCLNNNTVTGRKYAGGIAGCAQRYKITNCVNNGAVKKAEGSDYAVGGIAGELSSSVSLENCYYNSTINTSIYDAGYDNSDNLITTEDCGKSGMDIVSDTVLDKLNIYARDNTVDGIELLYWKASDGVLSFTSETPTLPYAITNNSSAYITVDSCARKDATVSIIVSEPSGLAVTGVTVKDADNTEVAVTQTATGYIFTMPESDVTVSAIVEIKLSQTDGVYQITSADEMKILSDAVNAGYDTKNKSFQLTSDVSLTTDGGFSPIGIFSNKFNGTFDGNGNTVNLDLDLSTTGYVGLFGCCDRSSVIKNVTTTGTVEGDYNVGGIAGRSSGKFINCQNQAAVTATSNCAGGISGNSGKIINCQNQADVEGDSYVGGIAGTDSDVINCLNTGTVTGRMFTGGIIGFAYRLTNCVNNGEVKAKDTLPVGGITGKFNGTLTNCYYNSTINTDICDAGYESDSTACTTQKYAVSETDIVSDTVLGTLNIYARDNAETYDTSLLYWKASDDVISLTSEAPQFSYSITNNSEYLTVASTAKNGDSVEITVGAIPSYMRLVKITVDDEELAANSEGKYVFTMPGKDVTVDAEMEFALTKLSNGSYAISTEKELAIFAKAVNSGEYSNAKAALTADITAKTAEGFEPIGTYEHPYEGAFYGNGHTLTLQLTEGVAYNGTTATGLFGVVTRADIYDLILKGSVDGGDKTDSYTGALIGLASNVITDVYNVYSEVSVSGSGYVGGIGNTYARLWNVVNNGTVTQKNTADDKKAVGAIMGTGIRDYTNVYYNSEKNSGMYDCGYDAEKNIVASNADSVKAKTTTELFTDEVMDAFNLYAKNKGNLMFWDISADTQTVKLVDICPAKLYEISPANAMSLKCITVQEYSRAGNTITVNTKVDAAYEGIIKSITGIKVTDAKGTVIEVTKTAEDAYEFVMPEKNVRIQVLCEYDITTDSDGVYCIKNAKKLMIFSYIAAEQPDANAKVTAESINMSELSEIDFTSDGLIGQNTAYKGEFDGNGVPIIWSGALFGKTDGAVIKNMNISTEVSCYEWVTMAGVVKDAKNTCIDNCTLVAGFNASRAAGIVGEATDSVITNCSVTASGGAECFGGIVGVADNTVVANCVLNESAFEAYVYGGIVMESYGDTKIYNCVNQDSFTAGDVDCAGAIVGNAEMTGLTLKNNFYYKENSCYDVYYDTEKNANIHVMTDENSAVAEADVQGLYIPARLNEFIEENPDLIEGTTLHKWSNSYNGETDSNAACFVDETHGEIYSIRQSDIVVKTQVSGNSIYGALNGAEVSVSGVAEGAKVTITDEDGNKVSSSLNGDTYVFTMPACDVTLSVIMDSGIQETTKIDGKTYVVVKSADDFIKAVTSIAAGNNILNVSIGADIKLTAGDLEKYPAYAETTPAYNGTFDGAGHTVTFEGLKTAMLTTVGEKGVVKNLTVAGTINGDELPGAAFAFVNKGTIFNCINQAEVSGRQAAGIALFNAGMIFNCINRGKISATDVSAAITYMNQGNVFVVANEGVITKPSGNGTIIGSGYVDSTCVDVSEKMNKSDLTYFAGGYNSVLDRVRKQMEQGVFPATLQALYKEVLEWSVSESDTGVKLVFADEAHVPYYWCTTPEGIQSYQAGSTVEVTFDTSTLKEGFVIGSVTVQTEYANEEYYATAVSGKTDTFSFTMPRKTCKVVMNAEAAGIEKDEDGYYLVGSVEDLIKVKNTIEYGNNGIDVKLTADIEGYDGTPIGGDYGYDGIFDGNSHSITLAMHDDSGDYENYGLFETLQSNAVVKNLTIEGSIAADGSRYVGAVAGKSYGTVTDCVNNATVTNNSGYAGGIVGSSEGVKNNPAKLSKCVNNGKVTGYDAGGIVCDITDYSVITDCENTGDVTATHDDAGGIATQGKNVEIINCENTGDVSGAYAGGVMSYPFGNSVINNCMNNGVVDAYDKAGGIVGYGTEKMTVRNCFNNGKVTGEGDIYAIAYYDYGKDGIILNSFYRQTEDVNAGLQSSNLTQEKDASEAVTEAEVTSGYVAYQLRSGQMEGEAVFWGQTLSGENADTYPVLGGKTVYRNETYQGCVNNPGEPTYSYSNKQEETVYAPHDYIESQDGSYHECSSCHEKEQHSDVAKYTVNETEHSISADCEVCGNLGTLTLTAPTGDMIYNGEAKTASVLGSIKGIENPDVTYKMADGTDLITVEPTDAGAYAASISLTDKEGKTNTVSVTYKIEQATPDVIALPTVDERTYDPSTVLVNGDLKGGTVNGIDGKTLPGAWSWKKTDIVPNADNEGYVAIFIPEDTVNYQTIEKTISVNVSKAEVAPNKPESTMRVPYTTKKVSEITTLPTDWVWKDTDKTKALEVGKAVKATAIYNGADKGNYEIESVEISITLLTCTHTWDGGKVTKEATPIEKGVKTYTCTVCKATKTEEIPSLGAPKAGTVATSDDGSASYEITTSGLTKGTVTYVAPTNKNATTVSIPATVTIGGIVYEVTAIADKAFANNKKMKKVIIGSNIITIGNKAFYKCTSLTKITIPSKVEKIGKQAFYGCKKLKSISIKSTKLTSKSVGSKAFKGIYAKAVVKVPKAKKKVYKTLLQKKGVSKSAKVK